jgi:hypothetical protein
MKFNILILSVLLFLSACAQQQVQKPLIKTDELLEQARKEIEEMARLGPKPIAKLRNIKKHKKVREKTSPLKRPEALLVWVVNIKI